MDRLSRRDFLSRALLAGAGATVFKAYVPGVVAGATEVSGDYDPGFIAGKVLALAGDVLTVLDPDDQLRQARLGPTSLIWKQGLWNTLPLEPGDCTYVRGAAGPDGSIDVETLWVNIHSLRGFLLSQSDAALTIELEDGSDVTVRLIPPTQIGTPSGEFPIGGGHRLTPGDYLQVIPFGDPDAGILTATLVLPLDTLSLALGPDESASSSTYLRISTWFCCGYISACGSGSCSLGAGACGSSPACRTDRNQMAWPRLFHDSTHCNTTNGLDCCTSLPELTCGTSASVLNPCNNKSVSVRVSDCGPSCHTHSSVGCKNRACVAVDLTACAFSAIGSLSAGLINVNMTV